MTATAAASTTPPAATPFTVTVTVTVPPSAGDAVASVTGTPIGVAPTPTLEPTPGATAEPAPPVTAAAPSPPAAVAKPDDAAPIKAASAAVSTPDTPPPPLSFWIRWKKWLMPAVIVAALLVAALVAWQMLRAKGPGAGFVSSNGRIEATEIDVASKFSGRVQDILVGDGDFVAAGQTLAHMQVQTLAAQLDEAQARHQQSVSAIASSEAQVAVRESDRQAALAVVAQRESEFDAARRRLERSETLTREGASSGQELDDDRARVRSVQAAVAAAKAQAQAAQAAITAAQAQLAGARSTVDAALATIARIRVDIDDSALTAPRDGRVQYRIAQAGEVLAAGGKVLNLIDLGDIYMTFFVPETSAGKLALGSEVHIILDAAPSYVIPAKVSFVASSAQFTPKTVETASERQKLMFRVKAQIDRALLQKNLTQIKTGLPGIVWLKLDAQAPWPSELGVKLPP